ncbi:MAG: hypothetical protein WCM76_14230 [Bacteroidota bacterium]
MKKSYPRIDKNQMSKITVKYFINFNLKESSDNGDNADGISNNNISGPLHPLYIKITFKRATTQLKSLINADFTSVEHAAYHCEGLMEMEAAMISDVISREYQRLGEKFSLKGIAEKCKPYSQGLAEYFLTNFLITDYNKAIGQSKSKYIPLLCWKANDAEPSIYFDAAVKLLGEIPELVILKERFDLYELFETVMRENHLTNKQVVEWAYGDAKDVFSQKALSSKIKINHVAKIIAAIDEQVKRIV